MVNMTIDDQPYRVEQGRTVLDVARNAGIRVPTLCYHPALRPSGSCRLCAVQVTDPAGRQVILLSCILKVREGLVVHTTGDRVQQARVRAFRRLLRMAPQADVIRDLAAAHGIDLGPPPDGCVRCRLCVRVCKQVVGAEALRMEKRDGTLLVVPLEGRCVGCGTCANICPTGAIRVQDDGSVRTIGIRDEVIGKHPLERCEGCGRYFATPKFLDHIQRRVSPHPPVKDHHRYCPTCAKIFSDRIHSFEDRKQRLPGHH